MVCVAIYTCYYKNEGMGINFMTQYQPKTVLITGATGDFGKAFAKRFLDIGAQVILHGRNPEKVMTLHQELGHNTCPLIFDVTDRQAMEQAIADLPNAFKNIDCLINNAGGALGLEKAQNANLDDWDTMIDTNVKAVARITRLILPTMVQNKRGHVINIGSIAGNWPYPGGHVYCGVKAFVRQFSLAIRADLQGTNIRVTNVEPGIVETQFSLVRFKGDKEKANSVYRDTTPLQAEDIAETVFWVSTQPEHVNINSIEVMPTKQSFNPLAIEKDG